MPIDLLGSSQQRLGVLRSKVLAAEDRVRQAEQQAKETGSRLEDARARNDEAMRELKSSRQEAAQARKLYDQESLAFERLRRGEAPGTKSAAGRP